MPSQIIDDVRRWRRDTLQNNLVWLASFGCAIESRGHMISVFHPSLPEYRAWLFYGDSEDLKGRLPSFGGEAQGSDGLPGIYVDQSCDTHAFHSSLTRVGFRRVATSVTYAGLMRRRGKTLLRFRRAEAAESDSWSAAYSAGFGRTGKEAALDLERWRLCFQSGDAVRSWFLMLDGETIGVAQTCHAHSVVGVYSVAMLPPCRRQVDVRRVIQAAQSTLPFDEPIRSYFEVVRSPERPNRNCLVLCGDRFDVVRAMSAYAHSRST